LLVFSGKSTKIGHLNGEHRLPGMKLAMKRRVKSTAAAHGGFSTALSL
jgi:hypothetical protein